MIVKGLVNVNPIFPSRFPDISNRLLFVHLYTILIKFDIKIEIQDKLTFSDFLPLRNL